MPSPTETPEFVYKIVSRAAFDAANAGAGFPRMPIDEADGYLHLSTAGQLGETLRLYFAGQHDIVVFAVRCTNMGAGLRWEASRGGDLFPHHYGDLAPSAIGRHVVLDIPADGKLGLPDWIK